MSDKIATSFRVSPVSKFLLSSLAERLSISQSAVFELAIREMMDRKISLYPGDFTMSDKDAEEITRKAHNCLSPLSDEYNLPTSAIIEIAHLRWSRSFLSY